MTNGGVPSVALMEAKVVLQARGSAVSSRPSFQTTVVLVDDHELARQGIRNALARDVRIRIVGEAGDASDAISLVTTLQPDVVLLDVRLSEGSGIEVGKAIRARVPEARILVVSAYGDERYVRSLTRLGVNGYLLKTATGQELRQAVRDVADGKLVFGKDVSGHVMDALRDQREETAHQESVARLTGREQEVLALLGRGLKNRDIAEEMGISPKTVEVYVEHILQKLGADTRTQAVLVAMRQGLL